MRIRTGRIADLDRIVAGNLAMARETEDLELDEDTLRSGVTAVLEGEQRAGYFLAEYDGRIIGQLMVTFEWSDWRNRDVWWIQSVYVWPEVRRRGVYRKMYDRVLEEAREADAAGVRLYVDLRNTRAQRVYGDLGMNGDHYKLFEAMFE